MERTVRATEACIRFGEMMRRAVEEHEAIIVERGGKPYVVMAHRNNWYRRQLYCMMDMVDLVLRHRKGRTSCRFPFPRAR